MHTNSYPLRQRVLEAGLGLHRQAHRLRELAEALEVAPGVVADQLDHAAGTSPPTLGWHLLMSVEAALDEVDQAAAHLVEASRQTDADLRRAWRQREGYSRHSPHGLEREGDA
ncbi:MAG: hypothetical protein AAGN66_08655 [Acidobacteriota bacterium]